MLRPESKAGNELASGDSESDDVQGRYIAPGAAARFVHDDLSRASGRIPTNQTGWDRMAAGHELTAGPAPGVETVVVNPLAVAIEMTGIDTNREVAQGATRGPREAGPPPPSARFSVPVSREMSVDLTLVGASNLLMDPSAPAGEIPDPYAKLELFGRDHTVQPFSPLARSLTSRSSLAKLTPSHWRSLRTHTHVRRRAVNREPRSHARSRTHARTKAPMSPMPTHRCPPACVATA